MRNFTRRFLWPISISRLGAQTLVAHFLLISILAALAVYVLLPSTALGRVEQLANRLLQTRSHAVQQDIEQTLGQFRDEAEMLFSFYQGQLANGPADQDPLVRLSHIISLTAEQTRIVQRVQVIDRYGNPLPDFRAGPYRGTVPQWVSLRGYLSKQSAYVLLLPVEGTLWAILPMPVQAQVDRGDAGATEGVEGYVLFAFSPSDLLTRLHHQEWMNIALFDDFGHMVLASDADLLDSFRPPALETQSSGAGGDAIAAQLRGSDFHWLVWPIRLDQLPEIRYMALGVPLELVSAFTYTPPWVGLFILLSAAIVGYGLSRSWQTGRVVERMLVQTQTLAVRYFDRRVQPEEKDHVKQLSLVLEQLGKELDASLLNMQSRIEQLKLLYETTDQFNGKLSLNDVVEITLEAVSRATQLQFAAIVLGEDELGPYSYAGVRGVPNPLQLLGSKCPVPLWGVLAQTLVRPADFSDPDYTVIHDMEAERRPQAEEFPWMERRGSLMILPLRSRDMPMGALILSKPEPNGFAEPGLNNFLYTVAGSAARALQNAQLREETTRWLNQLISLQLLTHTITQTYDLHEIMDTLTAQVVDMFGQAAVQVMLHTTSATDVPVDTMLVADEEQGIRLEIYTAQQLSIRDESLLHSPEVLRLVKWVIDAGQPIFYDPADSPVDPDELFYRDNGRALLVPITGDETTVGVIHISAPERSEPFDESDMIVMRTIANSAVVAIENARLYHELSRMRLGGARALAAAVDIRLDHDLGHSERVGYNAELVARHMDLSDEACQTVRIGAILHDIGKAYMADADLFDATFCVELPGSEKEQQHALLGSELLQQIGFEPGVVEIVAQHHLPFKLTVTDSQPRHNGGFSPDGLEGRSAERDSAALQDICLGARIVAVVNAVDRMLLPLPGRPQMSVPDCLSQIRALAGCMFDPEIVDLYARLVEEGEAMLPAPEQTVYRPEFPAIDAALVARLTKSLGD